MFIASFGLVYGSFLSSGRIHPKLGIDESFDLKTKSYALLLLSAEAPSNEKIICCSSSAYWFLLGPANQFFSETLIHSLSRYKACAARNGVGTVGANTVDSLIADKT